MPDSCVESLEAWPILDAPPGNKSVDGLGTSFDPRSPK
jgi:hypothetical protein